MAAVGSGRVRAGPALMSSAGGGTSSRGGAGLPIGHRRRADGHAAEGHGGDGLGGGGGGGGNVA